jgi:hypothetical protein
MNTREWDSISILHVCKGDIEIVFKNGQDVVGTFSADMPLGVGCNLNIRGFEGTVTGPFVATPQKAFDKVEIEIS